MGRQQPGGTDDVASAGAQPTVGLDRPGLLGLVVNDAFNASVAFDVAIQVEFVRPTKCR